MLSIPFRKRPLFKVVFKEPSNLDRFKSLTFLFRFLRILSVLRVIDVCAIWIPISFQVE